MAEIVYAAGAPHAPGLIGPPIFGTEAGKGATVAVNKLVESLQGKGSVA